MSQLTLAQEADDNAARERLRQLESENQIKQHSFELREKEIDLQARVRERALSDARDHLLSLSRASAREHAVNQAYETRIVELETQVEHGRQQLASWVATAIAPVQGRQKRCAPKAAKPAKPVRRKPARATKRHRP